MLAMPINLIMEANFLAVCHLSFFSFFFCQIFVEINCLININNLAQLGFVMMQGVANPTDDSLALCSAPSDPQKKHKVKRLEEEKKISK